MDYDPESKAKRVLELTTPVVLEQRPRTMEKIWALIACCLFVAWLDSGNLAEQIVAERINTLKAERERCEVYTKALTAVLNGKAIEVEGSTHVSCKARPIRSES